MAEITTCLWFDTEGLEAAEFYVSVFPDAEVLDIQYWGATNPERQGQPLTVRFRLGDRQFVALNGGPGLVKIDIAELERAADAVGVA